MMASQPAHLSNSALIFSLPALSLLFLFVLFCYRALFAMASQIEAPLAHFAPLFGKGLLFLYYFSSVFCCGPAWVFPLHVSPATFLLSFCGVCSSHYPFLFRGVPPIRGISSVFSLIFIPPHDFWGVSHSFVASCVGAVVLFSYLAFCFARPPMLWRLPLSSLCFVR